MGNATSLKYLHSVFFIIVSIVTRNVDNYYKSISQMYLRSAFFTIVSINGDKECIGT